MAVVQVGCTVNKPGIVRFASQVVRENCVENCRVAEKTVFIRDFLIIFLSPSLPSISLYFPLKVNIWNLLQILFAQLVNNSMVSDLKPKGKIGIVHRLNLLSFFASICNL